jgi:hypothetical protein
VQPETPRSVFAGTPVLLYGETESDATDRIELTWDGGRIALDVPSGDPETGAVVRLLQGSRLITDWEIRYPSEDAVAPLEKRQKSRVAGRLVELSKTYGLASREMSLVAVVKRLGDRPGELPETRVVPVGMPEDTAFSAYFGRSAKKIDSDSSIRPAFSRMLGPEPPTNVRFALFSLAPSLDYSVSEIPESSEARASNGDLVDLAAILESDGGMPGDDPSIRAGRTMAAVLAFVAEGHTITGGAFRLHVTRLAGFLKSLKVASGREERLIDRVLEAASSGKAPRRDWLVLVRGPATCWDQIEEALK